jgi:hypothetical protein
MRDTDSDANSHSNGYSHANSYADGDSNGYAYTDSYANCDSNGYAYTDSYANCDSNGHAYADSYADGDSNGYAYTDSNADGHSNSYAYTDSDANVDAYDPAENKPDTKAISDTAASSIGATRKAIVRELARKPREFLAWPKWIDESVVAGVPPARAFRRRVISMARP